MSDMTFYDEHGNITDSYDIPVGNLEWLLNNSKDPEGTLRWLEELDQLLKKLEEEDEEDEDD